MRALLVLAVLAACGGHKRGPDERIAREYREKWDARAPAMPRPACADHDAKRDRMLPLIQLAVDASKVWTQYDRPLPAPIDERLAALAVPASAAEDLRCLLADPVAKPAGWDVMDIVAVLLERKAEESADWTSVLAALHVFRAAHPVVYIYFFEPAYLMERATKLAAAHPPPPELRAELVAAAHEATMPIDTLCAGFSEELLAQGAGLFYGHLTALRAAFLERWGNELADLYSDDYARRALPSYDAWRAFRALWDPVATCTTTPPAELRAKLAPLVAALQQQDAGAGQMIEVAAGRLDAYGRLRAAEAAFAKQLGP